MTPPQQLRMTPQRQVILEEIGKTDSHPTTDELYDLVRRRLPRISLGTVYRNLEVLAECGLIQKLELAGYQRRFDGNTEKHYHIRCVDCGRVRDLPTATLVIADDEFRELTDYEIIGHRLEFIGRCSECKKEQSGSGAREPNNRE